MAFETVLVEAGGSAYSGWKAVRISSGGSQAFPTFDLEVAEVPESAFAFPLLPETTVKVRAVQQGSLAGIAGRPLQELLGLGTLLIDGQVDEYSPAGTPESHTVSVTGSSKTSAFVDSGIVHPTGTFEDMPATAIVRQLAAPFGITVQVDTVGAFVTVPLFQIRQGSTPWAEAIRLLQGFGLTLRGNYDGSLTITDNLSPTPHPGQLKQGDNVLRMFARLSSSGRHSEVRVIGQAPDGVDQAQLQPFGLALDPGISRFKPLVIIDQAATSPARAQKRAAWEVQRAHMQSVFAEITVKGWRDDAGTFWTPGRTIHVDCPWLQLDQAMFVETVDLEQNDRSGTTATLQLTNPPKVLAAEAPPAFLSGSGDVWRFKPPEKEKRRNRGEY